jgi:hypothetical protein
MILNRCHVSMKLAMVIGLLLIRDHGAKAYFALDNVSVRLIDFV